MSFLTDTRSAVRVHKRLDVIMCIKLRLPISKLTSDHLSFFKCQFLLIKLALEPEHLVLLPSESDLILDPQNLLILLLNTW